MEGEAEVVRGDFVYRIMNDRKILPIGRAVSLVRLLCRGDIVRHLDRHGRNVRDGRLASVHMQAVVDGFEPLMCGIQRTRRVGYAVLRHDVTGVSVTQLRFVWAALVHDYFVAAQRAGLQPTKDEERLYLERAVIFGRQYGLEGLPGSFADIKALLDGDMGRIRPVDVTPGGWRLLGQLLRSEWFVARADVSLAEIAVALQAAVPVELIAALRR